MLMALVYNAEDQIAALEFDDLVLPC